MARRLQNQKRSEYQCPPKACPAPADLRGHPSIMHLVRLEWRSRMDNCRSGAARKARASAKGAQ